MINCRKVFTEMKKIVLTIVILVVMFQGVTMADVFVDPLELTRGVFLPRVFFIYIDVNTSTYMIDEKTIVEFGPFTSGFYLGHKLDPISGLHALCWLRPALFTRDRSLDVNVYGPGNPGGGVKFSLPVKTFLLGGVQ